MARRGFFAEIQHQNQVAAREAERQRKSAVRDHQAAVRRAEQARKTDERARAKAARAEEADQKRLEKEAKAAHVAAKEAEVEELNAGLAEVYDEVDSLLAATLAVDDYVDLESLRPVVEHPPFDRPDLETALAPPPALPDPPEPVFAPPPPPKGMIGRKKRQAQELANAQATHGQKHAAWRAQVQSLPAQRQAAADERAKGEAARVSALEEEKQRYQGECEERESVAATHTREIDELIANLGYGTAEAVQEYVGIVLSNSVYPEHFPVNHDFEYDPSTAELQLKVLVPPSSSVPDIKAYKYTKSTDVIATTALSQKACKERYAGAVQQVALRSLHEVFEADRRGLIKTIAVELGAEAADPATGKINYVPFVAVAADRDAFLEFDLSAVVPLATLEHLGAAVSKNPHDLVAADTTGVRPI